MTTLQSKYKGYCSKCHFTIWKNEYIEYSGQARHVNCLKALLDDTPRVLDNRYVGVYGNASKSKIAQSLKTRHVGYKKKSTVKLTGGRYHNI